MSAGVVGYGSIGMRHSRILSSLNKNVAVVSKRKIDHPNRYSAIDEMLSEEKIDYLVIANNTSDHWSTLKAVQDLGFKGTVLVEKPLSTREEKNDIVPDNCFVGYNLRFHPVLQMLKRELQGEIVLSSNIYVGQYLPQWRPDTDYRKGYSACKDKGGGVLRDLSHELDYASWLFGDWVKVISLGGKLSDLEIDSDDHFTLLSQFQRCSNVCIHLNYLDHIGQRRMIINTNSKTYIADLRENTLQINDKKITFTVERDDTYISMHQALLNNDYSMVCTIEEAIQTMRLIDAAEQSQHTGKWVYND